MEAPGRSLAPPRGAGSPSAPPPADRPGGLPPQSLSEREAFRIVDRARWILGRIQADAELRPAADLPRFLLDRLAELNHTEARLSPREGSLFRNPIEEERQLLLSELDAFVEGCLGEISEDECYARLNGLSASHHAFEDRVRSIFRSRRHPNRTAARFDSPLPAPSSLAELNVNEVAGPPPPGEELTTLAQPIHQPIPETTVPSATRWWNENVDRFLDWYDENRSRRGLATSTRRHWRGDLRNWRTKCVRLGLQPPGSSSAVTAESVRAVRDSGIWRRNTLRPLFCALRLMCSWAKNPIADKASVWRLDPGTEDRRHWLDERQMDAVFRAASGRVLRRVVLQEFNGLREDGVRFLRARHLDLALPTPTLTVREKGKSRSVPVLPTTRAVLIEWAATADPEDQVYPVGHSVADGELAALGLRVGLPFRLSGHVLRRSFGRAAYHAGVSLETIRRVYGHASIEQTLWYIGVEPERDAIELRRFEDRMAQVASDSDQEA